MPLMAQALRQGKGDIIPIFVELGPSAAEVVPHLSAYHNSARTLEALKAIGPDARSALPNIEPLVTNSDPVMRMVAASAVAQIQGKPELAVPVLLDGLEGRLPRIGQVRMFVRFREPIGSEVVTGGAEAAAILLGECGRSAQTALPALEEHLDDSNLFIRLACAQAIFRISGSTNKALPVLLEILDAKSQWKPGQAPDKYLLVRAIETIEEMGPAAKPAIPLLRRVRTSCMAARHAVNSALRRIEAAP
jgi:HEAT repeat protein